MGVVYRAFDRDRDAPVALLSTSPERDDVVLVQDPFAD